MYCTSVLRVCKEWWSFIHPLLAVKSTVWTTVMAHWVQLVSGSLLLSCLHVKGVLLVMAYEVYLCLKDLLVNLRAFYFSLVPRCGGGGEEKEWLLHTVCVARPHLIGRLPNPPFAN